MIHDFGLAEPLQVDLKVEQIAGVPVDREKRQRSARLVVNAGNVEIGNVVSDLKIVAR